MFFTDQGSHQIAVYGFGCSTYLFFQWLAVRRKGWGAEWMPFQDVIFNHHNSLVVMIPFSLHLLKYFQDSMVRNEQINRGVRK